MDKLLTAILVAAACLMPVQLPAGDKTCKQEIPLEAVGKWLDAAFSQAVNSGGLLDTRRSTFRSGVSLAFSL